VKQNVDDSTKPGVTVSMHRKRLIGVLAGVLAAGSLALPIAPAQAAVRRATLPKCPLAALKKATKPVEITMWHSMTQANETTLQKLADQFNSSQSDVHVKLVNQTTYRDTLDKYVAGLSTGDLPDLVQIEDTGTQQMIDTQSVLPAAACVKADHYDLSDHIKRVIDYYTVNGTLWPMPFNVSNPIFLYNKKAFTKAGLDPNKSPSTFDEVKADAKKLKDSGAVSKAGMGLKLDAWHLEQWTAMANKTYVNNGNGRKSRATGMTINTSAGVQVFTWLSDMVNGGFAVTNPADGSSAFNNLLGIGSGDYGMTIDTSAVLGTVRTVLASGQYPNVEVGVGPMPGPTGGGHLVGGAALYISNKSKPEKQAAAYEFAKFLNDPKSQITWAVGTGYIPIRKSAANSPEIKQLWATEPGYKVAFDQITTGVNDAATAGPVIGDYQGVRDAVLAAESTMFTDHVKPKAALKKATSDANATLQEYNSRVGG
jgi:sn-glycerol 3-phosphate transport system substrate-binding protein